MNTASLELCKELFKVSRWNSTTWSWYCDEAADDDPVVNLSEPLKVVGGVGYFDHQYPAYDLGYLVRKFRGKGGIEIRYGDKECSATSHVWTAQAETPEDAAALLAIHHFKQGIFERTV